MNTSRVIVSVAGVTNTCFVVMPFHELYEAEYEKVIRPAIEDAGLTCVRGDEIYARQSILHDIWNSIRQARLIVAELSGRNANVFYEVGLAHAIGKPIILLTRNEEDVPFDLRSLRYVYYDQNDPYWGANLRTVLGRHVRTVLDNPELATHLDGIEIETEFPEAPEPRPQSPETKVVSLDLSGTWSTIWRSIRTDREHRATLIVPAGHGSDFTASMIVTFTRHDQQTVVQQTLTASLRASSLSLVGVNYTYVQQGSASSYSLDSFDLRVSENARQLVGKARLRHGEREVTFVKQQGAGT